MSDETIVLSRPRSRRLYVIKIRAVTSPDGVTLYSVVATSQLRNGRLAAEVCAQPYPLDQAQELAYRMRDDKINEGYIDVGTAALKQQPTTPTVIDGVLDAL